MEILAFIISSIISFFTGILISDNTSIRKDEYVIKSKKIKNNARFVYLTDLHAKQFGKDNSRLIKRIKEIDPDFILIGGDFITTKYEFNIEPMFRVLGELANSYSIYFALGNHESRLLWDAGNYNVTLEDVVSRLNSLGVIVLDNQSLLLNKYGVKLTGITLGEGCYRKKGIATIVDMVLLNKLVRFSKDKSYHILLAHNPEYFNEYSKLPVDLVLSGHMHGGIMRLPSGHGFISPRFKLFKSHLWGVYKSNGTRIIISRGLANHTIPVRLFNPPEITVVNLRNGK